MPFFVPQSRINQLEDTCAAQQKEIEELRKFYSFLMEHGGQEAWDATSIVKEANKDAAEANALIERYKTEISQLKDELSAATVEIEIKDAGLDVLENPASSAVKLQIQIKELDTKIKNLAQSKKAIIAKEYYEGVERKTVSRQISTSVTKLALLSFNSQAQILLNKVTAANLETSIERMLRLSETIEKLGKGCEVRVNGKYVKLWVEQLVLAVEHMKAKKLEQDLQREHKAELREQAKVERELEQEKKRLEKEMAHYRNVLARLGEAAEGEAGNDLREQIEKIEAAIADVDYRQANQRAGYVYVISNIGAFGEQMVKIGMTRRLDPMDRVRELSDASVPFNFDVHALFFTEDAVGVEHELHQRFADRRVNLVNLRREFFAVSPVEVKEALVQVAGNLLEFVEEPEADQYRQSLELRCQSTFFGLHTDK